MDIASKEELTRLVAAILLTGDAVQWGHAVGVYHSLHGLLDYLDCPTLWHLASIFDDDLDTAIWMTMRAVPDREVTECRKIIRKYLHRLAGGDLREAREADGNHVREFVATLTKDPVVGTFLLRVLGHSEVRCLPTTGASLLLMRLEVLSAFQSQFFVDGYPAIQEEARKVLEQHPVELALMAEWFGVLHCPESCPVCPARMSCPELCRH